MKTLKDSIIEELGGDLLATIDKDAKELNRDKTLELCTQLPYLSEISPNHDKYVYSENYNTLLDGVSFVGQWSQYTIKFTFDNINNSYKLQLVT